MALPGRRAFAFSYQLAFAFTALLAGVTQTRGEEIRDFAIRVQNKPSGYYRMTITEQGNGATTVNGEARVDYRKFVVRYTYSYDGTEVWQNGRLVQLDSIANDNGKAFRVSARAQQNGIRVQVNGQVHNTRPDVWTTSYWRLADPNFRNRGVPLLDSDTGEDLVGQLRFVDTQNVNVGGQVLNCAHYKLTGAKLQVELWYDGQERLVRELTVEQGEPTLLELQRITTR
jgi:hypothetical protein